jgi:putative ABC transport system ATP-binding protein
LLYEKGYFSAACREASALYCFTPLESRSRGLGIAMTEKSTRAGTIRTEAVCRHYQMGDAVIRAIDGISLEVGAGEFVALLGSSGSGKSSLLNLIAGLDRPTSGAVIVNGDNLAEMSSEELSRYRRHSVGIVFQAFNLVGTMTLLENVELPMRFAETERGRRLALAREALQRVGLGGRLTHRPSQLSGGEQQRAALARALANRPSLLLADEPTGNLDSHTGNEILDLLHECNEQLGMTLLLVTHERALAERYAERLVFLADGKVVGEQANARG